jgi:hypothetical protein
MKLRFGGFTFDGDTRQLLRAGHEVHVSPKAFELLEILIECRPRALSKTALQARLWPDTFVSEANLPNLVSEIRDALGDVARAGRFVRTVHGYGYAFCGVKGPARGGRRPRTSVVSHWLMWEKVQIPLAEAESLIGREPNAAVWLDLPSVSRRHARILIAGDQARIEDLGSKNGTCVNGELVRTQVGLRDGDEIRIGSVTMRFRVWSAEPTQTQANVRSAQDSTRRARVDRPT